MQSSGSGIDREASAPGVSGDCLQLSDEPSPGPGVHHRGAVRGDDDQHVHLHLRQPRALSVQRDRAQQRGQVLPLGRLHPLIRDWSQTSAVCCARNTQLETDKLVTLHITSKLPNSYNYNHCQVTGKNNVEINHSSSEIQTEIFKM